MPKITEANLRALVSLLLDDDPKTVEVARRKLVEHAAASKGLLAESVRSDDPRLRARARPVLDEIRVLDVEAKLKAWSDSAPEGGDLEEGTYLLAAYANADLDPKQCSRALDEIAAEVKQRLGDERRPVAVLSVLRDAMFGDMGFRGNKEAYFAPENSYIDRVLAERKGIPITLSAIVLFVAKRLSLPIHGVTMPCHFIVRWDSPEARVYFDPFGGGRTLSREECLGILKELDVEPREEMLVEATPRYVLRRMMTNLRQIYEHVKDDVRHKHITRFIEILRDGGSAGSGGGSCSS